MNRGEDTMIPKYSTIEGSLDNNSNNRIKRNNQQFVPISKTTVQLKSHVQIIGQTHKQIIS